jgi:1-acyl-sn-glycerol-3-phosphate acyltransferase
VTGWDKVPEQGGMLVVGNHSGGTLVPDTAAFIAAWYRERGMESTLMGLAFDGMFGIPGVETVMRKIGQIPANPENAGRALDEGAAVMVYPGGAHEAFRPWGDRNKIDFAGRTGFIMLALRKGVPVVPVVGHGGQESVVILARGDSVGKRLGFDRLRTTVSPLMWQVPWGVSIPLFPGVPLPAKITMEILEPMDWSHYGPEAADDPDVLERCYEEITGSMQATLTRLAKEHPYPVAERLWSLLPGVGG